MVVAAGKQDIKEDVVLNTVRPDGIYNPPSVFWVCPGVSTQFEILVYVHKEASRMILYAT